MEENEAPETHGVGDSTERGIRRSVGIMRNLKYLVLLGILLMGASYAQAQVRVGVGIGVGPVYAGIGAAPVCAYGYYPYYPYACAPYGYYGPDWIVGGVFIGAGPWYHGWYGRGYYGRPGWAYGRGGYSNRPGWAYGRAGYGNRPGWAYRGSAARGYAGGGYRGNVGGGFRGNVGGGFHGGGSFHSGGGFHGGGGGHGGGHR